MTGATEMNKTIFTRLTGAIFSPGVLLRCLQHKGRRDEVERDGRVQDRPHLEELAA